MCLSERELLLSLSKSEPLFIKYEHNGWMTIMNNVLFVTVISHLTRHRRSSSTYTILSSLLLTEYG